MHKVSEGYMLASKNSCKNGKWTFINRKSAKQYASKVRRQGGDVMRPYQCNDCNHWHIGHLPGSVKDGRLTVSEIYDT